MGHSKAAKEKSHQRIVKTAAARFRERGVDGIGVAELMKEADLTHWVSFAIGPTNDQGYWANASNGPEAISKAALAAHLGV